MFQGLTLSTFTSVRVLIIIKTRLGAYEETIPSEIIIPWHFRVNI
jgi:hypothetical protein